MLDFTTEQLEGLRGKFPWGCVFERLRFRYIPMLNIFDRMGQKVAPFSIQRLP